MRTASAVKRGRSTVPYFFVQFEPAIDGARYRDG